MIKVSSSKFGSMLHIVLLPDAISEIVVSVAETCQLTLADRYALMAAILDESLSSEERAAIDRILRSIRRGKIQVVNELSRVA